MEIDLTKLTPDTRYLDDMKDVVSDKEWLKTAGNPELYFMYRGVKKDEDIRYDITIIPGKMLGSEFVKTKGHYHLNNWQEVYTVLEGTAIYLMQKRKENGDIEDAYFVKAKKGDFVVITPGYGHVTINPLQEELKMANWVSENCKVDYEPYEKLKGACYYYTNKGWIKNNNYKSVPPLREEQPLKSLPEDLSFLKNG